MNTLTFFVLGISLRETESQLRRENNNFSSFRNLAHVLDSSTSYSFKDVGQLHNQIAEQLHTKMLEHPPSTEEEYLDMVLQQTIESFCLPDDIDCRINQENYFYETRDVMMSEYDKSNDSRRRLFINQYPEIQTYFDRIVDYLTSITLENKEEQLDKIRKISNDIESSNATETTVSVVQGVASVAVSSTEFWTEHLMNPKSAYFMFIREILEKVGLVESDNFEIVSVSKLCMTRLAISIVFWDVFGAIRWAIWSIIALVLQPSPLTGAFVAVEMARGSVTYSLEVLGIYVPSNLQIGFHVFEHFTGMNPLPDVNYTAVCDPFTWGEI